MSLASLMHDWFWNRWIGIYWDCVGRNHIIVVGSEWSRKCGKGYFNLAIPELEDIARIYWKNNLSSNCRAQLNPYLQNVVTVNIWWFLCDPTSDSCCVQWPGKCMPLHSTAKLPCSQHQPPVARPWKLMRSQKRIERCLYGNHGKWGEMGTWCLHMGYVHLSWSRWVGF